MLLSYTKQPQLAGIIMATRSMPGAERMDNLTRLCYKLGQRVGCGSGRGIVARALPHLGICNRHNRPEDNRLLVQVRDNNVDQALKALKKKMQREGIFREMKLRNYYEKPSEKRVREQAEAVRRARKLARKRAQREGLLPGKTAAKPGTKPGGRPGGPGRGGSGGPPRSGGGSGFGGPR
jgi:small subunit ribosomal protein S21